MAYIASISVFLLIAAFCVMPVAAAGTFYSIAHRGCECHGRDKAISITSWIVLLVLLAGTGSSFVA